MLSRFWKRPIFIGNMSMFEPGVEERLGPLYMIWSTDNCAWWGPFKYGYTTATHFAGLYTLAEANKIIEDNPEEIMVKAPSCEDVAEDYKMDPVRRNLKRTFSRTDH